MTDYFVSTFHCIRSEITGAITKLRRTNIVTSEHTESISLSTPVIDSIKKYGYEIAEDGFNLYESEHSERSVLPFWNRYFLCRFS